MKKIIIGILISIMIIGCGDELPPEPGTPGAPVGKAVAVYEGYAPVVDVFDKDQQIFFLSDYVINLEFDQEEFDLTAKIIQEDGFIYKKGFIYTKTGWEEYEFEEKTVGESNWIRDRASKKFTLKANRFNIGENYVLAYSCKKYEGVWRCGYRNIGGQGNLWMLQTFVLRKVELPPEPIKPEEPTTTRVYLSPSRQIYYPNKEINIFANYQSTQETIKDIKEPTILIEQDNPTPGREGVYDKITLKQTGDLKCQECEGEYCYRKFLCHINFVGTYNPTEIGTYYLRIENPQANLKVDGGEYKVITKEEYSKNLIEENIYVFKYNPQNSGGHYWSGEETYWTSYIAENLDQIVDIRISNDKLNVQKFKEAHYTYEPMTINGMIIFHRTYINDEWTYTDYAWVSDNKVIDIMSNLKGRTGISTLPIINRYLELHPSSEKIIGLPPFVIGVDDKAPSSDIKYAVDIATELTKQGYEGIDPAKLFSEIDAMKLDKQVTLLILDNVYVIVVGATSPADHTLFAVELSTMLREEGKVVKTILSSDVESEDLHELFDVCDIRDNIQQGETKTYTIEGLGYEIEAIYIGGTPTETKFKVNGETTKGLEKGESFILSDGSEIKITELVDLPVDEIDWADFCLRKPPVCEETDEGIDYYTKGEIIGYYGAYAEQDLEDSCLDRSTTEEGIKVKECSGSGCEVKERYCSTEDKSDFETIYYVCPNGCKDGACIPEFDLVNHVVRLRTEVVNGEALIDVISGEGTEFKSYGNWQSQKLAVAEGENPKLFLDDVTRVNFVVSDFEKKETLYFEVEDVGVDGVEIKDEVTGEKIEEAKVGTHTIGNSQIEIISYEPSNQSVVIQLKDTYADRIYTADGREVMLNVGEQFPSTMRKMWINEPDGTQTVYYFEMIEGQATISKIKIV